MRNLVCMYNAKAGEERTKQKTFNSGLKTAATKAEEVWLLLT